jgi:hypothetical protein
VGANWSKDVERLCELNRQRKALEEEARALGASLLERCDAEGREGWENEFLSLRVVEQAGREFADVAQLKAAGLLDFIRTGGASRYVLARRK